ncbi:MAG TPA: biotin--[acetyl-CoA-carboxylase] ligase [Gemmatimonadales bacterium]|jgi:BirA family biotin operon repressor/biotin-[acetyl-CoA-carboxylase] ligase
MIPRIQHFERVGSTMDVIHELAARGAEAGTIVVASEQLDGRGSRGRTWHSPPGGLWLSALFRPPTLGGIEVVSLRVGLAVARAVEPLASGRIQLKWPNDLMLNQRKVGGILCEARWQGGALGWVAVGIGLNVRNQIPAKLRGAAVSLAEERPDITGEEVTEAVVTALEGVDFRAERLSASELEQFADRDWLRGREIRQPLRGTVTGLGDDGTLLVRTPEGPGVSLRSGSVQVAAVSRSR